MFNEHDVLRMTLLLTVIFTIIGGIAFKPTVGLGILLGGLISYFAFRLMVVDSGKMLKHSIKGVVTRKQATKQNWRSFLKRCSLYGGALVAAAISPYLNYMATFLGLLLPRLAIALLFILRRTKRGT